MDSTAAGLDAQLRQRASACLDVATAGALPADVGLGLAWRARAAQVATGLGPEREHVENALSRELREAVLAAPAAFVPDDPRAGELLGAVTALAFARSFYNEAALRALEVRNRRLPRLFHLAGRAPMPASFEIDDTVSWESVSRVRRDRSSAPLG